MIISKTQELEKQKNFKWKYKEIQDKYVRKEDA